jgi:hypothetical protein
MERESLVLVPLVQGGEPMTVLVLWVGAVLVVLVVALFGWYWMVTRDDDDQR